MWLVTYPPLDGFLEALYLSIRLKLGIIGQEKINKNKTKSLAAELLKYSNT